MTPTTTEHAPSLIRVLMNRRSFSATTLAAKTGFSRAAIFAWLQRRRAPTWESCKVLAHWLKVEPKKLFMETRTDG